MAAVSWASFVLASPSWYSSMRGLGIGRMNGGCDLVVGIGVLVVSVWGGVSPICGIEAMRAQWSLWMVGIVVMVVSTCMWVVVGGRRRSQ